MPLRSKRRLFTRRRHYPLRLLGALTLVFAGSFAAAVITIDWPEAPARPHVAASPMNQHPHH